MPVERPATQNNPTRTFSIGFGGLLALLFIGLKLTGHIDWSWLWVLAPLWLPAAAVLAIVGAILVFAAVCTGLIAVADFVERRL